MNDYSKSSLFLTNCLETDQNQENLTTAVELMMKIKIKEKDFYEAYHVLNRSQNTSIKQ